MASLRVCLIALVLAGTMLLSEAHAQASKRFALIIGNSNYENTQVLPNAAGDAKQLAEKLTALGFEVDLGIDLARSDFKNLVSDFRAKLKASAAEDVVFFYGGHGFSLDGFNHLVPVDAGLKDKDLLAYETLTLDEVIESIRVTKKQNTLVFLDACRNNPLPKNLRGEGVGDGLSELKMSLRGTLVSFATEHGQLTGDGLGKDSPYARALLKYIDTPNQSVNDLLVNVRVSVSEETNEKQFPVEQGALFGQVVINRGVDVAALQQEPNPAPESAEPAVQAPIVDDTMTFEQVVPEAPAKPAADAPAANTSPAAAPVPETVTPAAEAPVADAVPAEPATTAEHAAESAPVAGVAQELPAGTSSGDEISPKADKPDVVNAGESIAQEYVPARPEASFDVAALDTEKALEPSTRAVEGSLLTDSASRTIEPIAEEDQAATQSGTSSAEVSSTGDSPVIEGVEVMPEPEKPADDDGGMVFEAPAKTAESGATPENANGAATPPAENEQETVVALNTPPEELPSPESGADPVLVARGIQEELRRVGCFNGSADGKWGSKSKDALGDYFKQKGRADAALEPSEDVLGQLKGDASQEVCVASVDPAEQTEAAEEPAPKPSQKSVSKPAEKKTKPAATKAKPAAASKKPAAAKPKPAAQTTKKPAAAKPKPASPSKKKPVLIIGM